MLTFRRDHRLTYQGKVLEDNKTLADYGIGHYANIIATRNALPSALASSSQPDNPNRAERTELYHKEERERRVMQMTARLRNTSARHQALQAQAAQNVTDFNFNEGLVKDLTDEHREARAAVPHDPEQYKDWTWRISIMNVAYEGHLTRRGVLREHQRRVNADLKILEVEIWQLKEELADAESALTSDMANSESALVSDLAQIEDPEEVKQEVEQEVEQEIKQEVKQEIKQEIKQEVKQEIKQEVKQEPKRKRSSDD